MSIVLDRIETSGFGRVMRCACDISSFESPPSTVKEVKWLSKAEEEEDWGGSSSTTTTSSIGRNSDDDDSGRSSDGVDCEENEVQSSYKGPLDRMNSIEQVLPMRRSISSFYNGKSRSYTSLAEANSVSSIKDIAKPETAYTRRRRNLLAINHIWDKNRSKRLIRPISSSKSSLALAVAMNSSETDGFSSTGEDSSSTSSPRLPPLHPQMRTTASSPWRSLSSADVREYN
ncbi:hypothetical protein F3Y22_tig00111957pilonHSYRG00018 [Hibiscus syriacus]|uniref:Uncharacterized protein n=1 Tax=Hibiscus syriacus TaxID=106335 RepID=A0A6A2YD76_HIBSY|nr:uncharacterized protein LOC120173556 [Hibiscus syriacus]KAE8671377.1 hypothetical protein F3Y22_tig00111957pilonHSYRG00018 [Hibiscus syriacus]